MYISKENSLLITSELFFICYYLMQGKSNKNISQDLRKLGQIETMGMQIPHGILASG